MLRHPWPSCWHRVMTGGPSIQELLWHGTVLQGSYARIKYAEDVSHITVHTLYHHLFTNNLQNYCSGPLYNVHGMVPCVTSVLSYCWLGLLTCKVANITYTVLVETLNHAQLINPQVEHCTADISDCCTDKWLQFNASKTVWSPLVSAVMSLTALCWWPDR